MHQSCSSVSVLRLEPPRRAPIDTPVTEDATNEDINDIEVEDEKDEVTVIAVKNL